MSKYLLLLIASFLYSSTLAQGVKVMTYNIRLDIESDGENSWTNRRDFLIGQIQFYEPDIFGVQEAKPNQVDDLVLSLLDYDKIGIGRDGENRGEAVSILFKRDRFKLLKEGTFWLSETPNVASKGWDAAFNRICTYGKFLDVINKKEFLFFNTHLDHIGELAKSNGIELILKRADELNAIDIPMILIGDFNSEPSTERIMRLKEKMIDTRDIASQKIVGPEGTFNGFNYHQPSRSLIDYIFISRDKKFGVKKSAILTDSKELKFPSDHFPVYVELVYLD